MTEPGLDLAELLAEQEKAALEGLLADLHRDEQNVKPINEAIRENRARIKAYHDAHPNDAIVDAERGYVASFVTRGQGAFIDLVSLADNSASPANTLLGLARAGLLSVSLTGLRALKGKAPWADDALHFLDPGGTTTVLTIQRIED
jgi:hypothetical protein